MYLSINNTQIHWAISFNKHTPPIWITVNECQGVACAGTERGYFMIVSRGKSIIKYGACPEGYSTQWNGPFNSISKSTLYLQCLLFKGRLLIYCLDISHRQTNL